MPKDQHVLDSGEHRVKPYPLPHPGVTPPQIAKQEAAAREAAAKKGYQEKYVSLAREAFKKKDAKLYHEVYNRNDFQSGEYHLPKWAPILKACRCIHMLNQGSVWRERRRVCQELQDRRRTSRALPKDAPQMAAGRGRGTSTSKNTYDARSEWISAVRWTKK